MWVCFIFRRFIHVRLTWNGFFFIPSESFDAPQVAGKRRHNDSIIAKCSHYVRLCHQHKIYHVFHLFRCHIPVVSAVLCVKYARIVHCATTAIVNSAADKGDIKQGTNLTSIIKCSYFDLKFTIILFVKKSFFMMAVRWCHLLLFSCFGHEQRRYRPIFPSSINRICVSDHKRPISCQFSWPFTLSLHRFIKSIDAKNKLTFDLDCQNLCNNKSKSKSYTETTILNRTDDGLRFVCIQTT